MSRSRRGRDGKKSPLTPGRNVLAVIIAAAIGGSYLVSSNGFGSTVSGFPFPCLETRVQPYTFTPTFG
jgi:hypothetical protein